MDSNIKLILDELVKLRTEMKEGFASQEATVGFILRGPPHADCSQWIVASALHLGLRSVVGFMTALVMINTSP
jgi:hypothetical protein